MITESIDAQMEDSMMRELFILREFFTHWQRLHSDCDMETKQQSAAKMLEKRDELVALIKPIGIML